MVTENTVMDQFWGELATRRYQGRIVSVQRLWTLQEEIGMHCREGRFHDEFYRERLAWFRFSPPKVLPDAQSIVVAVPRPQTEAMFNWRGKPLSLILPPTYTDFRTNHQAHLMDTLRHVFA